MSDQPEREQETSVDSPKSAAPAPLGPAPLPKSTQPSEEDLPITAEPSPATETATQPERTEKTTADPAITAAAPASLPPPASAQAPHTGTAPSALEQKIAAEEQDAAVLEQSRSQTRRSFVVTAAAAVGGYLTYEWLEKRPGDNMQPSPYRRTFEANAALSRRLFNERALAPTYPPGRAENLRVNGVVGLKQMLDPGSYRLQLTGMRNADQHPRFTPDVTAWEYRYLQGASREDQGHDTKAPPTPAAPASTVTPPSADTVEKMAPASMLEQVKHRENRTGRMPRGREEAGKSASTLPPNTPGLLLTLEDVLKLPRHELITEFKCIEGWSQVVQWAGIRMVDFLEAYPPALQNGVEPRYVYMETPDGDFYVSYDMHICRHPQTLLVTEMMGAPLTQFHGAPLRIHMPTRYGYKQIKRVGLISYTNTQPDDYWTKLGYDWYAGL